MLEPAYYERIYGPRLAGKSLNVGLGDGYSARVLLGLRGVNQVVSIDNDVSTISAYQTRFIGDPLEVRHSIINVNINTLGAVLNATKPFNYILIDTIITLDDVPFSILRTFLSQVKADSILAPGGVVQILFQADVPAEREFRVHWLPANFNMIQENIWGFRPPRIYWQVP
jgi:hypothetical protein